jgi:REP element-mobilizing transposase RayT
MPNRHRLHVPGGTYYIFRRTDARHPIFTQPEEYTRFGELLPISLASSDAKLLAYCLLAESVHLVVQIGERPVALFMRDLMWRYSRSPWHRLNGNRPWFRERYRATLVQSEIYLESLVRYIHYLPVRAGIAADPGDYAYSSHLTYLGQRSRPPVSVRRLLELIGHTGNSWTSYTRFMAQAPPENLERLFACGLPNTPGILGNQQFLSQHSIEGTVHALPRRGLIEKLIGKLAEHQGLSVADIRSKCRRRELVIARAQIVWLALQWNLGTLTDIARHLQHSPSAMTRAVARYSHSRPDLFTTDIFTRRHPWIHQQPASGNMRETELENGW